MFNQYGEIFLEPKGISKYVILVNKNKIGKIQRRKGGPLHLQNIFYLLFSHYSGVAIDVELVNDHDEVQGYIRKESGIRSKDFHLFSPNKDHLGFIQYDWSLKDMTLTAVGPDGKAVLELNGSGSDIDFQVIDCELNNPIASIRKRSLVYETVKENLSSGEGYYIRMFEDEVKSFMMIALGFAVDFYQGR